MAKLSELGVKFQAGSNVRVVEFVESTIQNSEGINYWELILKEPVQVGCSTDNTVPKMPFESLYCLPEVKESDKWEGTPEEGFSIPGFITDFSKGQMVALYQENTIKSWVRGKRTAQVDEKKSKLMDFIKAQQAKK